MNYDNESIVAGAEANSYKRSRKHTHNVAKWKFDPISLEKPSKKRKAREYRRRLISKQDIEAYGDALAAAVTCMGCSNVAILYNPSV